MGDVATDAGGLPRLDIFDHEFQREPPTVAREHQRTIGRRLLVGCLLGAAIISLPALAWLNSDALPESAPSAPMILQSASSEPPDEVARLALEIAMLKRDLDGLAHAHQRAVEQNRHARGRSAIAEFATALLLVLGSLGIEFRECRPAAIIVVDAPGTPRHGAFGDARNAPARKCRAVVARGAAVNLPPNRREANL